MGEHSNIENIDPACSSIPTSPKNKCIWNIANTKELLDIWKDNYCALKSARRNSNIYKRMAADFSNTFDIVPPLTGLQIQAKINNLRKQFKREKLLVGNSGGAPSKWWPNELIAAIIGGEASLDNGLLSESQDLATQDFFNRTSPIVITEEDGDESISVMNLDQLDTDDLQSILSNSNAEPGPSTSGINEASSSGTNEAPTSGQSQNMPFTSAGTNKRRRSVDRDTHNNNRGTEPVRIQKKASFASDYLKLANKNIDIQLNDQEMRLREVSALEEISKAIKRESDAKIEYYRFLMRK